jgi:hypothetical protein
LNDLGALVTKEVGVTHHIKGVQRGWRGPGLGEWGGGALVVEGGGRGGAGAGACYKGGGGWWRRRGSLSAWQVFGGVVKRVEGFRAAQVFVVGG